MRRPVYVYTIYPLSEYGVIQWASQQESSIQLDRNENGELSWQETIHSCSRELIASDPYCTWYRCNYLTYMYRVIQNLDWRTIGLTDWWTDRPMDWQTDGLTDWWTDRLMDWRTSKRTESESYNIGKWIFPNTPLGDFLILPNETDLREFSKLLHKVNGPITDLIHIISDKKYYSFPIYLNFCMYILYFVLFLIRQVVELNFTISLTQKLNPWIRQNRDAVSHFLIIFEEVTSRKTR